MVLTVGLQKQAHFTTSDPARLAFALTRNGVELDPATDSVKIVLLGIGGSAASVIYTRVTPSVDAIYNVTSSRWIVDFTADHINNFLEIPADDMTDLAYTKTIAEIEMTGVDWKQTVRSEVMTVIKGYQ